METLMLHIMKAQKKLKTAILFQHTKYTSKSLSLRARRRGMFIIANGNVRFLFTYPKFMVIKNVAIKISPNTFKTTQNNVFQK